MNTYRYDEQKRRSWVREKNNGTKSVKQICKEAGISRATLYNWISEFPDAGTPAEVLPDPAALPENKSLSHHDYEPGEKYELLKTALLQVDDNRYMARKMVQVLVKRFTMTVSEACEIVGIEEDAYGYKPRKPEVDDQLVYDELSRLIAEDRSRGFPECYNILQQTYPGWTRKQIKRVYKIGRLYLKRTRNRRASQQEEALLSLPDLVQGEPAARLQRPGATWNLGCLREGEVWMLFLMDDADKAPLNARMGMGHPSDTDILSFLSRAAMENGVPRKLRVPGRNPFNTREITRWIWENKVALHTLSMAKEENQQEVAAAEEQVRRELSAAGGLHPEAIGHWLSLRLENA